MDHRRAARRHLFRSVPGWQRALQGPGHRQRLTHQGGPRDGAERATGDHGPRRGRASHRPDRRAGQAHLCRPTGGDGL